MIAIPTTDHAQSPAAPPAESVEETTTATAEGLGQGGAAGESPATDGSRYEPTPAEIYGGMAALSIWMLIFAVGIIFPSEPFRTALAGNGARLANWMVLPYILCFMMTYTASNAAILCAVSAWLGELGRRTRIDGVSPGERLRRGDYIAAVMRGFLTYLAILTGFVVVGTGVNVFVTPSPEGYVRLASVVSLTGFLAGFNPALFRSMQEKISGQVRTEVRPDGTKMTTISGPAEVTHTVKTGAASPGSGLANGTPARPAQAGADGA